MERVRISPTVENIFVEGNRMIGFLEDTAYEFESSNTDFTKWADAWKECFSAAIAMASKGWQIEYMFEEHYGVKGKMGFHKITQQEVKKYNLTPERLCATVD